MPWCMLNDSCLPYLRVIHEIEFNKMSSSIEKLHNIEKTSKYIFEFSMKTIPSKFKTERWLLVQMAYKGDSNCLELIYNLHSTKTDPIPHISLCMYLPDESARTFHLYCVIDSYGRVFLQKVTSMNDGEITVEAEY